MPESYHHTPEMIQLATYKMATENNALMRMILANQIKIINHLQIDHVPLPLPLESFDGREVETQPTEMQIYLGIVHEIEQESRRIAYNFAVETDSNLDTDLDSDS